MHEFDGEQGSIDLRLDDEAIFTRSEKLSPAKTGGLGKSVELGVANILTATRADARLGREEWGERHGALGMIWALLSIEFEVLTSEVLRF